MAKKKENVFIEISNKDIYEQIIDLKRIHEESVRINTLQHNEIILRQDQTNGRVKLSRWISTTALSLAIILLGFLFNHVTNS